MKKTLAGITLASALIVDPAGAQKPSRRVWQDFVREVRITSTADATEQPAMFYAPPAGDTPRPLLVSLHTWSAGYTQVSAARSAWCRDHQWVFVHPHFRGPNNTPAAMGSELAVQDILDAVAYAREKANVDPNRIYLLGFSGGGHAALLMAGRAPDLWAGVSAWCGISDLKLWHAQNPGYGRGIEAAAGGNPQADEKAAAECVRRSPVTWLDHARHIPIDIAAGIHDGHTGSVPISQSLNAFNILAAPADRLSAADIDYMVRERAIPEQLRSENAGGQTWRRAALHFQRISGNVRVTIFEGGHTGFDNVALPWLAQQHKGHPALWSVEVPATSTPNDAEATATGK